MPAVDFDEVPAQLPMGSNGLSVRFYTRQVRDEALSRQENRPIHAPKEFVQIYILGDKTNIIDRPVEAYDKQRFAKEYAAFKADKDQDATRGQPLKDWVALPENLAEDWAAVGVKTVEQLIEVPEHTLHKLGPLAREYQRKAQKYLEAAKMDAPLVHLQSELDKRDAQIAELERKFGAVVSQMKGEAHAPPIAGAAPMPENQSAAIPTVDFSKDLAPKGPIIRKKG